MGKIFDFLIKKRYWILAFFLILAIGNIFLMRYININYDISSYLAKGSNTRVSIEIMDSEFESNGSFQIMVEGVDKNHANQIKEEIASTDGVKIVIFNSDDESSYKDGNALYNVFLKNSNFDTTTRDTVNTIKEKLKDEKIYLTGGAIESLYLGDAVNDDMVMILLMALIVVFIILIINSVSWIEPVIFMIVIGVAILINMGSNALLPSISFVTGSICAVMQLALAMDYSIMLLHRYIAEKENNHDISNYDAVKNAIKKSLMPILSSGLTTVAGLISLVFMNFKIGIDIGIVLSKGIIISLIVVIIFMPGLLFAFSNLINKTRHRNLHQLIRERFPKMEGKISHYQYKSRYVVFGILASLIVVGFIFYLKTNYIYTLEASNEENSTINVDKRAIENVFGIQNNVVVLLPKGEENKEQEVNDYLLNYDYNGSNPFSSVSSIITTGLNDSYTKEELASRFNLPESIIEAVYKQIDETKTQFKLQEVISYLKDTSFISDYTSNMQDELDNLYDISLLLNEQVNSDDLSKIMTDYTGIEFSKENASALIKKIGSDLTFKEFLLKINNDKFFDNLYNDYASYVDISDKLEKSITKEELLEIFTLEEDVVNNLYGTKEVKPLKESINEIDQNKIKDSEKSKYDLYKHILETKDITYTKDEVYVMEVYCYNIIPKVAYAVPFLLNNKLSNYDIQKFLVTLLSSKISDATEKLNEAATLLDLVDAELTANEISEYMNIPLAFISPIYEALNKDKITGLELLSYVKDNNYIIKAGDSFKEKIEEASFEVDYALSSFESDNYSRIILNLKYSKSARDSIVITKNLQNELHIYYDEYYIASECGAFADFEDTFASDSIKISVASLCFILLIIAFSFKSIAVPIILTLTIQGAIWFTMAISVWTNWDVYFICYLMIVCIQMGTTIDYGILYTSKYLEERKHSDIESSIASAYRGSITTILTSGTIIVVASFIVGVISKVSIISSIGFLLSVGTIVSLTFILFALPQVLVVSEKFIMLTTIGYKNIK